MYCVRSSNILNCRFCQIAKKRGYIVGNGYPETEDCGVTPNAPVCPSTPTCLSGLSSWLWEGTRLVSRGLLICGDADCLTCLWSALAFPRAWFRQPWHGVVCPLFMPWKNCGGLSEPLLGQVLGTRLNEVPCAFVFSEVGSFVVWQCSALRWGLPSDVAVKRSRSLPAALTLGGMSLLCRAHHLGEAPCAVQACRWVFTRGGSFSQAFRAKTSESNLNAWFL